MREILRVELPGAQESFDQAFTASAAAQGAERVGRHDDHPD
jgi:hypothetical protein